MEYQVFKTMKAAKYEAAKALKTASETLLITGIETEKVEGGFHAVVYLDQPAGQPATPEDMVLLEPFIVRQQEREEEAPTPVEDEKPTGAQKPRAEWGKSSVAKPIDICRAVIREMRDKPRADVLKALEAFGVHPATARTQYTRVHHTMKAEDAAAGEKPAPEGSNVVQLVA